MPTTAPKQAKQEFQFDDHKLYWHLDRVQEWQDTGFCMPLHLDISPSGRCNARCIYCLFHHLDCNTSKRTDWDIPRDILLQLMRDARTIGARSIAFVGDGEPFCNEATPDAICEAHKHGVDIAVATNGILIKQEDWPRLLEALTWIRFSLCAASPEGYSKIYGIKPAMFDRMRANLTEALRVKQQTHAPATIGSVFLLIPENFDEMKDAVRMAIDLGLDYLYIKQYVQIPENPLQFDFDAFYGSAAVQDALHEVEDMGAGTDTSVKVRWNNICSREKVYDRCLGIPFLCHVGSDSKCYVCAPKIGDAEACYGDLRQQGLPEILNGPEYREMVRHFAEDYDVHTWCPESCREDYFNRWLWKLKHPPQHVNFI